MRLFAVALLLLVAACEGDGAAPPGPADATYTVRGRIVRLPAAEGDRQMYIEHETIAGFRDREGREVGMKAMTMPFAPAESLSIEGLERGDPVRFTFEVRWDARPMLRMTQIEELPAGTSLELAEPRN